MSAEQLTSITVPIALVLCVFIITVGVIVWKELDEGEIWKKGKK